MTDKVLDLNLETLDNGFLTSEQLKDKPFVIFNSASQCGRSKQFKDFQEMYVENKIIPIALPTNEFGNQEPGSDDDLLLVYKTKFNVSFPICKKTDLNHKLFQNFGNPSWNFNKYLFDKNHNFVQHFDTRIEPKEILKYINQFLPQVK